MLHHLDQAAEYPTNILETNDVGDRKKRLEFGAKVSLEFWLISSPAA